VARSQANKGIGWFWSYKAKTIYRACLSLQAFNLILLRSASFSGMAQSSEYIEDSDIERQLRLWMFSMGVGGQRLKAIKRLCIYSLRLRFTLWFPLFIAYLFQHTFAAFIFGI
jgi:hypothetical protein